MQGPNQFSQLTPMGHLCLIILTLLGCATFMCVHQVPEGYVGVYFRGGALLQRTTDPGFHFKIPLLDSHYNVQVSVQTDKVTDIPCGTSGGVMIWIEKVEVVNRLRRSMVYDTIKNYTIEYDRPWIFDKIHHEINQFCSKHTLQEVYIDLFHTVDDVLMSTLQEECNHWAPGIEIIAIRITKPRIPSTISANYELADRKRTEWMAQQQHQKVVEEEAHTERLRSLIEANKTAEVSKMRMDQQIRERESERQIKEIDNQIHLLREHGLADALFYRRESEAKGNSLLFTPEYLYLEMVRALANNTKIFFGPSLNAMFAEMIEAIDKMKSPSFSSL